MNKIFDEYQKAVINSNQNTLVIAGPGSGKTTTIIEKINFLLKTVSNKDILLISFTNKSVNDLKSRINSEIFITTFHKLAIDILNYNNIKYSLCKNNTLSFIIDEYFECFQDKRKLCKYLNISKFNKSSQEYESLKKLVISFINIFKTNNHNINSLHNLVKNYKDKFLLKIIFDILYVYEEEKNSLNVLDFDDLIVLATKILNINYNYKKFKYIIIDEFQDTSLIRLNLIKIIEKNSHSIVTAVGDDAQSIFHFAGCDLNIFLNFQSYFDNSIILFLKNTYRNSQELINISNNFINKNKNQISKNMIGKKREKKPIEIIYYYNPINKLCKLLDKLITNTNDILILVRNKKDIFIYINDLFKIEKDYLLYKNVKIKYMTIHSAKGLESSYVIILNVSNNTNGIPNKIENHPIITYLITEDAYPYAEERRVFYVAITRCKIKTYLFVPRDNPSMFIKEIKKCL